jgi:hypothetical protein
VASTVEEILSYILFLELAQLAVVMREIGCPNFFAYLKLQGTSKQSGRKILTSIFFNKTSANDHLLILNFQKDSTILCNGITYARKSQNAMRFYVRS